MLCSPVTAPFTEEQAERPSQVPSLDRPQRLVTSVLHASRGSPRPAGVQPCGWARVSRVRSAERVARYLLHHSSLATQHQAARARGRAHNEISDMYCKATVSQH
eukprot:5215453-Pleurochrysis_carterae.AAC.1